MRASFPGPQFPTFIPVLILFTSILSDSRQGHANGTAQGDPTTEWTLAHYSEEDAEVPAGPVRAVSFNLHGPPTGKIDRVIHVLRNHPALREAGILAFQEVNRDHPGSGNRDVAGEIARALGLNLLYTVELEYESGGVRGLALMSRYPISDPERFLLPVPGPRGRRRLALGATVQIGETPWRVFTTHLETKISVKERVKQIEEVVRGMERRPNMPTLILGDFNTYNRSSVLQMFRLMEDAGFSSALRGDEPTFQRYLAVRLKLDWIWARGLRVLASDVEADIVVSDHRPVWADLRVD